MDAISRPRARDTHRVEEQPHVQTVNTKVKLTMFPFNAYNQPYRRLPWALIVGGACGPVLCVVAGVVLGMIVGKRGVPSTKAVECAEFSGGNLPTEQSTRFPTGQVKVRSANVLSSLRFVTLIQHTQGV